jgi:hypothetical protein
MEYLTLLLVPLYAYLFGAILLLDAVSNAALRLRLSSAIILVNGFTAWFVPILALLLGGKVWLLLNLLPVVLLIVASLLKSAGV